MATLVVPPIRMPSNGVPENINIASTSSAAPSTSNWSVISQPGQPILQPFHLRPAYRFKSNVIKLEDLMQDGPGRRLRKNVANVRKHIDINSNILNYMDARLWQHSRREKPIIQPDILYQSTILPPSSTIDTPVDCVCTKFVRAAMNKVKCPVYSVCWTPEGKRLITGASSGEFTLWNGTAFNFETILQAHDVAVRALKWSHNDQWMASADHDGFVKYWQPNMNNVHMFQAHKDEPIRGLSFSPTDIKLATASDDGTARIWDFARCLEERVLRGHGADVRSIDWHPTKGLLVTGSRDSQQPVKLWDPKTGQCLATLHDHKNSVMSVEWNKNGNWLLTGSRDHLIKLYDIRMMREMQTFRGHKKEVTSLAWHPIHEDLFVSGGGDGSLAYWLVHNEKELALLEQAHDQAVWTMQWHPLGHLLATGSNDNNTKFWARNRPGDTQEDIFGLSPITGVLTSQNQTQQATGTTNKTVNEREVSGKIGTIDNRMDYEESSGSLVIPGMGLDEKIYEGMNRDVSAVPIYANSLPGLGSGYQLNDTSDIGAKRTLIKQPPPKKAQRQFERMWNISKPNTGDGEDEQDGYGNGPQSGGFHGGSRTSLLGPPPGSAPRFPPPSAAPRPLNRINVPNREIDRPYGGPSHDQQNDAVSTSWRTGGSNKKDEINQTSNKVQPPPNFMPPPIGAPLRPGQIWRLPPGVPLPPPGVPLPPFILPPFIPRPPNQSTKPSNNSEDMDYRMVEDVDFRRI